MALVPPSKLVFNLIGDGIWFFKGSKTEKTEALKHPTLIIIFAWMGAQMHQLRKFVEKYHELYPGAGQILIQIEYSFFWSSQAAVERQLHPAAKALVDLGCIPPTDQRILVHSISNGGGMSMHTIGKLLHSNVHPEAELPTSAFIIDSAPGITNRNTFTRFCLSPITDARLRTVASVFFRALYFILYFFRRLGLTSDPLQVLRDELLKDRLLPWADKQAPWLYVYSKKDLVIPWKSVHEHIEKAREKGFDVQEEVYETSLHVGHSRDDPERYWNAVQRIWEHAVKVSERRKKPTAKL